MSTLLNFSTSEFPGLASLVTGQTVKFEITGEVTDASKDRVLIRISSFEFISKSKMSTQEILMQNHLAELKKLNETLAQPVHVV